LGNPRPRIGIVVRISDPISLERFWLSIIREGQCPAYRELVLHWDANYPGGQQRPRNYRRKSQLSSDRIGENGLNEQPTGSRGAASAGENTFLHNKKRIQQVLEIERQAETIHEAALREAEQLPIRAEQEAQALVEKVQADAQQQAHELVASAQAQEACAQILAEAEEKVRGMDALARSHFDRAVDYVLDRVVGRE
jgi:vacuolar-type H+-ATPase subunit H